MKNKKILFSVAKMTDHSKFIDAPEPAKKFVPEWYKNSERFTGEKDGLDISNGFANLGIKMCMPFLDSMISGYNATLWTDIHVQQTELGPRINWRVGPDPLEQRPKTNKELPTPAGHHDIHFAWKSIFYVKTPPGYSCLITHPFNRYDLPFTTLSGIADTDTTLGRGNVPFFLKKDFEGIIKAGTPIFQILPFKREKWVSENTDSINEEGMKSEFLTARSSFGWYKDFLWNKKSYE